MKLRKLFPVLLSGLVASCPIQRQYSGPAVTAAPYTPSALDPGVTLDDIAELDSMKKEPYSPRPIFETWWQEVEECAHKTGDFNSIRFFHVFGDIPCKRYKSKKCDGLWFPPNKIYFSDRIARRLRLVPIPSPEEYSLAQKVAKHEMFHNLLQESRHTEIFRRCGVYINN
ncbi:MAG: hypothetical protein ABSG05_03085 [Candidatus Pacearchaeota archaeon]|jgi:hypothetical protein